MNDVLADLIYVLTASIVCITTFPTTPRHQIDAMFKGEIDAVSEGAVSPRYEGDDFVERIDEAGAPTAVTAAAEARREAVSKAAEARREAVSKAAEARREAESKAAEARREAESKARRAESRTQAEARAEEGKGSED